MAARSFWILPVLLSLAGVSSAQTRLYLKARTLADARDTRERQTEFPKRRAGSRPHILVQFRAAPQEKQVLELKDRGVTVLEYVPEAGFLIAADDPALLEDLDLVGAGWLRPEDKLSPLLSEPRAGPPGPAVAIDALPESFLIEFHRDVDAGEARALVREHELEIRERTELLPNHLLVQGPLDRVAELAAWDEVAYIYPASRELLEGAPVYACAGAATVYGPIGQYVAKVGEGWDGPGRGAADLGYFLEALAGRIPRDRAQAEVLRALAEWSKYVRISLLPAADRAAPRTLTVLFASGAHGDPYPFDGRGRVLAHTFYPAPLNPEPLAGDMHFDDDEPWGIGEGIDLFTVVLHEAGHALGLGHSDRPGTVMYPYYRPAAGLTADDIAAIRELYAATEPAQPKPPDPPPSPPQPPPQPKPSAPVVRITSPTTEASYASPTPSIQLAGVAEHPDGVVRVLWANSRGGAGQAAGTSAWMTGQIALQPGTNVLTVTAWAVGGNSASQSLAVLYSTGPDTVAPSLTILSPAGTSVLTYDSSIAMRGAAADNVGVTEVTWTDSTGATGAAQGTNYWRIDRLPLREGTNTITIRARDAAGNIGWRAVSVTRRRR